MGMRETLLLDNITSTAQRNKSLANPKKLEVVTVKALGNNAKRQTHINLFPSYLQIAYEPNSRQLFNVFIANWVSEPLLRTTFSRSVL